METLCLDVQGVTARLTGDADALDELAAHFFAYRAGAVSAPDLVIHFVRGAGVVEGGERLRADQVLDRGLVYNAGKVTWVDHHGHGVTRYDFGAERGAITAPETDDLVEMGYLMLHSRIGVLLERRGFVRLHCVGLELGGRAALLLGPSGAGKSTLALAALRRADVRLLGDDMVLIDASGKASSFHSPVGGASADALRAFGAVRPFRRRHHPPKWTLDLAATSHRRADGPCSVALIAELARVNRGPSRLEPLSRADTGRILFRDLVIGLGLPQVFELVARRGARDLVSLAPSAFRRVRAAERLLFTARGARLEVSNPDEALELVVRALARATGRD